MINTFEHTPVLLNEVLKSFEGLGKKPSAWMVDGTFGRGGHSRALLNKYPQLKILALDIDHEAIEFGKKSFSNEVSNKKIHFFRCDFSQWQEVLAEFKAISNEEGPDAILLDLGVSSPQLDDSARGFSFYKDGPLDMRMDHRQTLSAKEIVNGWGQEELLRVFKDLGEISSPLKVVNKIIEARVNTPFETTKQLAELIEMSMGWKKKGFHPATQFFMALRLAVNSELSKITDVVPLMISSLKQDGIVSIITFHSLEDRIVKYKFKESSEVGYLLNKKVIAPTRQEEKQNPRARSSKLRSFVKGPSLEKEYKIENKFPSKYRAKQQGVVE